MRQSDRGGALSLRRPSDPQAPNRPHRRGSLAHSVSRRAESVGPQRSAWPTTHPDAPKGGTQAPRRGRGAESTGALSTAVAHPPRQTRNARQDSAQPTGRAIGRSTAASPYRASAAPSDPSRNYGPEAKPRGRGERRPQSPSPSPRAKRDFPNSGRPQPPGRVNRSRLPGIAVTLPQRAAPPTRGFPNLAVRPTGVADPSGRSVAAAVLTPRRLVTKNSSRSPR